MTRYDYQEGAKLLSDYQSGPGHPAIPDLRHWLMSHAAELIGAVKPTPMKRGSTASETCSLNGWKVGDRLHGGPDGEFGYVGERSITIDITAIGEERALARLVPGGSESLWSLDCREWWLACV